MDTLADTWMMWLIFTGLIAAMMTFYRQSRRSVPSGMATLPSQDEFSIRTILFGFKRGEGDLFVGYFAAMICFSLFLAGIVRWGYRIVT